MDFTQQRIKILIVDDDAQIRKMLVTMLKHHASTWEVLPLESGRLALEHIATAPRPDIILCDLNMPEMNGYQLLEQLRSDQENAGVPLIFLSGMSDAEHQRQGMNLGADDYLTKPVTRSDLLTTINARLTKSMKQQEQTQAKLDHLRKSITLSLPHELRTPLVILRGNAAILSKNIPELTPERIRHLGSRMLVATNRLHRLVENYIAYSQLELFTHDPERIALMREAQLPKINDIIEKFSYQKCDLFGRTEDLKVEAEVGTACIAEEYFNKALNEILDNAIKFSKAPAAILVQGKLEKNTYVVSVTDHGEGMSAQAIESLGAFFQLNREKREQQGSGLGLHLAKVLIEIHAGQLEIESELGSFTRVTMRVPAV